MSNLVNLFITKPSKFLVYTSSSNDFILQCFINSFFFCLFMLIYVYSYMHLWRGIWNEVLILYVVGRLKYHLLHKRTLLSKRIILIQAYFPPPHHFTWVQQLLASCTPWSHCLGMYLSDTYSKMQFLIQCDWTKFIMPQGLLYEWQRDSSSKMFDIMLPQSFKAAPPSNPETRLLCCCDQKQQISTATATSVNFRGQNINLYLACKPYQRSKCSKEFHILSVYVPSQSWD